MNGWTVVADLDLCQAHQMCRLEAPGIFGFDAVADKVVVLQEHPAHELRAQANRAVAYCPTMALAVVDSPVEEE